MNCLLPLRSTLDEAQAASDTWGFNCGPGAICAVLNLTPDEIRPKLGDFEKKGYTNPTLMKDTLTRCGVAQFQVFRADTPGVSMPRLTNGLVRVQWGGPWTRPGVPWAARYRQTHWVGVRDRGLNETLQVFDINAMCAGGWIKFQEWESGLVPWLLKELCPKADGSWWPTHGIEVR
jgi:hypothetical protein